MALSHPTNPSVEQVDFARPLAQSSKADKADQLVRAFEEGHYRTVRSEAKALAHRTDCEPLKALAETLSKRTEASLSIKFLFLLIGLLLLFLVYSYGFEGWACKTSGEQAEHSKREMRIKKSKISNRLT